MEYHDLCVCVWWMKWINMRSIIVTDLFVPTRLNENIYLSQENLQAHTLSCDDHRLLPIQIQF